MALVPVILSMTVEDADGERMAAPIYGIFNDAVSTLGELVTYVTTLIEDTDAVLDGKVVKAAISLSLDLSGAEVKASPAVGSEIERTALVSFNLMSSSYSYGLDLPAFAAEFYVGNAVDQGATEVAALINQLLATSSTFQAVEPVSGKAFSDVRSARKTFRKHRKSTLRS